MNYNLRKRKSADVEENKKPVIQVRNLYKVYRLGENKVYALRGVDFTIYRGEFCAIIGPSGSGKSTLLNMLAGLEKPSKGEVVIAGQHIEKMNENQAGKIQAGECRVYLSVLPSAADDECPGKCGTASCVSGA